MHPMQVLGVLRKGQRAAIDGHEGEKYQKEFDAAKLAVSETVILPHLSLHSVGFSTGMVRERQQNGSLVNGSR